MDWLRLRCSPARVRMLDFCGWGVGTMTGSYREATTQQHLEPMDLGTIRVKTHPDAGPQGTHRTTGDLLTRGLNSRPSPGTGLWTPRLSQDFVSPLWCCAPRAQASWASALPLAAPSLTAGSLWPQRPTPWIQEEPQFSRGDQSLSLVLWWDC